MSLQNETINPYEAPTTCSQEPAVRSQPKLPLGLWFVFVPTTLFSLLVFLYVVAGVGFAGYISLHKDQMFGAYGIEDYFAARLPGDWVFIPLCIFAFTISLTLLIATIRTFFL